MCKLFVKKNWIKKIKDKTEKTITKIDHRFFLEVFEGKGLRIDETKIAASEGPKAPIFERYDNTILLPFCPSGWPGLPLPAIIAAKIQITHEIKKVRNKNDMTGFFRIIEKNPGLYNLNYFLYLIW